MSLAIAALHADKGNVTSGAKGALCRRGGRALLVLTALLCLASCGGGGGSSASSGPAEAPTQAKFSGVSGRIYPAAEGVVLYEFADDSTVLQASSVSDADGKFLFVQPLTGVRIAAEPQAATDRVHPLFAARLAGTGAALLEVTPLTTWFDQLIEHGETSTAASEKIRSVVTQTCWTSDAKPGPGYVYADAPFEGAQHDWFLSAMSAYLEAARGLGVGPRVDYTGWIQTLTTELPTLTALCAHAAQVSAPAWRTRLSDLLVKQQSGEPIDTQGLAQSLAEARRQSLSLLAKRLRYLRYPQEAGLLKADYDAIAGRELTISEEFATAHYALMYAASHRPLKPEGAAQIGTQRVRIARNGTVTYSQEASLALPAQAGTLISLRNDGSSSKSLHLSINGQALPSLTDLIAQIIAMPVEMTGEPLYRKAWRYVIAHRQRSVPVAAGMFQHQPDLWIRSIGSSYCDAQAAALFWIWQAMGYEARIVGLTGHVTVEIRIDGRWQVFDPYLQTAYRTRQGLIAGVADLELDPGLITAPVQPTLPLEDVAYSSTIAEIFASTADNFVHDLYMKPLPQPFGAQFELPAGARVDFVPGLSLLRPSTEAGQTVPMGSIRLWLPPGFKGTLPLNLLLVDVQGQAQISLLGRTVDTATTSLREMLDDLYLKQFADVGVASIQVSKIGPQGLTLTLMLSPLYFQDQDLFSVEAASSNMDGLSFSSSAAAP